MAAVADRYPFEPGSLTPASRAHVLFDRYPHYRDVLVWLREEVARGHPDLGRRGAICPRVAPALRADVLWLAVIRSTSATAEEAAEKGRHLADLFVELCGGDVANAGDTSLIALFPDVAPSDGPEFIDRGHAALRMEFIERGMMIGEFHPVSNGSSAHNPSLLVMRSPWPMFVVRAMTPHDLMFLLHPRLPAELRLPYLRQFERHIGPRLGEAERRALAEGITAAAAGR